MAEETEAQTGVNWKAVILAGLIAGLVFIVMEMVLVAVVGGGSPLGPPTMIGAIVLTLRHRQDVKRQNVLAQMYRDPAKAMELKDVKPGQGL